MGWRDYQLSTNQKNILPQTPLTEIKKPILIESGYLNDTFYLVGNKDQAEVIEQGGGVCYLPEEIGTLLVNSNGMDEETLKGYLTKVHQVKKTFEGSRIKNHRE